MSITRLGAFLLLLGCWWPGRAQELAGEAPGPVERTAETALPVTPVRAFYRTGLSRINKIELGGAALAISLDCFSTRRFLTNESGAHELNPLTRPFTRSDGRMALGGLLGFGGLATGNLALRNHTVARHVTNLGVILLESALAAHNFGLRRRKWKT